MYKSKLQELCHAKGWGLPGYSSVKDGPDHSPQFSASVVVNGLSFPTTNFYKNSKEAQNEAARIAFVHFTSSTPPPRPPTQLMFIPHQPVGDASSSLSGSSSASNKMKDNAGNELNNTPAVGGSKLPKNQEISRSPLTRENASVVKDEFEGIQTIYKNQLLTYAQRHNITPPTYCCVREGPAHAPRFKATVTIDEQTFESPMFFKTLKEAEHAAARVALMSFPSDGTEMEERIVYKNLLQELIWKENLPLPVYATTQSGASHMPTFLSTVEIDGEVFYGKAAKNKKQAEANAAKVAFTDLKERRFSRTAKGVHPNGEELGATEFTSSSSDSVNSGHLQQNLKPIDKIISATVNVSVDDGEERRGRLSRTAKCVRPNGQQLEATESTSSSSNSVNSGYPRQNLEPIDKIIPATVNLSMDHGEERRDGDQEVDLANTVPVSAKVGIHNCIRSPESSNMRMRNNDSTSDIPSSRLSDPFPSVPSPDDGQSSPSMSSDFSSNLAVESENKVPAATETSRLLCNRVRIYSRMPNLVLPKDVTILPISDDKWVAVSLEFPDLAVQ